MNLIINKINFIKCIYKIEKKDIGKEIIIINDEYYFFNKNYKNKEIKNNIKIKRFVHFNIQMEIN
jgi:hypothetical protein